MLLRTCRILTLSRRLCCPWTVSFHLISSYRTDCSRDAVSSALPPPGPWMTDLYCLPRTLPRLYSASDHSTQSCTPFRYDTWTSTLPLHFPLWPNSIAAWCYRVRRSRSSLGQYTPARPPQFPNLAVKRSVSCCTYASP
ncbi:hypothetical protein K466DRAFT_234121 [Polyporus arcularius HHB13444]|uniref:Uncharacterized protein n=1 Tax=Polyporus arcularius HHB13444 TaxID=1314778 RepID=A0A5C3P4M4_9APHY|nr:hypothetical protein K466DRAFT_234121 [Polyporus arcularius HHB13444]